VDIRKPWNIDPYQILFPLGILHSILGAVVWVTHAFAGASYPGTVHAYYMVTGFLVSFAAGFMMTAIPRFTGSQKATEVELALAAALSASSLLHPSPLFALGLLTFLAAFFIRRIRTRTFTPPPYFVFLPVGLVLGIAGATLLSLIELNRVDVQYLMIGRVFLFHGPMLAFILGIGAKLISALLGWSDGPLVQISGLQNISHRGLLNRFVQILPVLLAALFLGSFLMEAAGWGTLGRALRAASATWIAIRHWHIHRQPKLKGKLVRWLWLSTWMLIIGLWLYALLPSLGIHAAHLYLIGAFGLMTLMIASRVTLAHGGYELQIEINSRIFTVTGGLIILAALTRFTAPWTQNITHHLAYAAITWILALLVWATSFVPRMVRKSKT
jgi:uncharacterized protein involved in response to NO